MELDVQETLPAIHRLHPGFLRGGFDQGEIHQQPHGIGDRAIAIGELI